METTLLFIIAVLCVFGFTYLSARKIKKSKADFEKNYGHLIGTFGYIDTRSWSFVDDKHKAPLDDANELSMPAFCKNCDWPTYLYCSICGIHTKSNGSGSYDLSLEQIRAEFEVQYTSDTMVILYSKKYGELLLKRSTLNIPTKVGDYIFLTGKIYFSDKTNSYIVVWSFVEC